jgi:hypothetical protein
MDTSRILSALVALAVLSRKERRGDTPMRAITCLVIALSWILSATSWATPPLSKYALTEIPSIVAAGGRMSASAINDRDEVVGNATQPGGAPFFGTGPAFFYQHSTGAVNQLTFGSEQNGFAFGINDNGIIAGYADTPDPPQAVLWSRIGGAEGLGLSLSQWPLATAALWWGAVGLLYFPHPSLSCGMARTTCWLRSHFFLFHPHRRSVSDTRPVTPSRSITRGTSLAGSKMPGIAWVVLSSGRTGA